MENIKVYIRGNEKPEEFKSSGYAGVKAEGSFITLSLFEGNPRNTSDRDDPSLYKTVIFPCDQIRKVEVTTEEESGDEPKGSKRY